MDINAYFFPEAQIDYFTFVDGTIGFYLKVKALYGDAPGPRVMDYGAGRGAWTSLNPSRTSRKIRDLRIGASETVAVDIDSAVLENVCSDKQVVIQPGQRLPFDDASFDIIVADYVFEHIADPSATAAEMLRILKPGGWICARTANKYGYVALFSRLIPNALHRAVLHVVQPDRLEVDVFPTTYSLSTVRAVRRHFSGKRVFGTFVFAEPSYHFNRTWMYRMQLILHKFLPRVLAPGLVVFIQK